MEYRPLGASGLMVSHVGLGCNNLSRPHTATATLEGTYELINAALESGVTLFDVADFYGAEPGVAEQYLGKALGDRRHDVIVATKVGMPLGGLNGADWGARGSRRYIIRAVESSLRRLGTDWIDLYQIHTPDLFTPIGETLAALDSLVCSGKVRYIGHSNFCGWQIAQASYEAQLGGYTPFISAQNHYNLLDRRAELEVLPASRQFGLGVLPYFPLANGLLTGKYAQGRAPEGSRLTHSRQHCLDTVPWERLSAFSDFARARELTDVQVAFSWLAHQTPVASVIAGATTAEQVRTNAAAGSWVLTAEDLAALDELFPRPEPVALF